MIEKLYERGIKNILVEGGENVLWSFLNQNLFDEINIFVASLIIGGVKTPTVAGGPGFTNKIDTLQLKLKKAKKIGDGILLKYAKKNTSNASNIPFLHFKSFNIVLQ